MPSLTDGPIAVTGATGYVASWVVHELLSRGATVHATVRDPGNPSKVGYLQEMAKAQPGTLELFAADLLKDGSFADAVEDCVGVIHTASPFMFGKVTDPKAQLIDPALLGTRNVLQQVEAVESVQRVVLTSSVAAMYGDCADCEDRGGTLTEEHWNETSSEGHNPYAFSKTLAEREAWKLAEAQDRWQLVTINPSFVMGPSLPPTRTAGASQQWLRNTIDGTWRQATFDQVSGWVDVRDVAHAHIEALVRPEAEGRHILCASMKTFFEVGKLLESELGQRVRVPVRAVPRWAAYLAGPLNGFSLKYVQRNVGHPLRFDNAKSRRALGIEYRPLRKTVVEHAEQILKHA